MSEPIEPHMLDQGRVSVRTALMVAGGAISLGVMWQSVKADVVDHDRRLAAVEQQMERNANTLAAICESLQCRSKGMAE